MQTYDFAVVGGGASGLVAAIAAARRGKRVVVLEQNPRIAKKLLATGNGKCNLLPAARIAGDYNTDFVESVLGAYSVSDVRRFFRSIGLPTREEGGRIYPYSLEASSVVNVLRRGLDAEGVTVMTDFGVRSIEKGNPFLIRSHQSAVAAHRVLVAVGSAAGGGKDSLFLLQPFGLQPAKRVPSLAPILTDARYVRGLRGVRMPCKVSLAIDGNVAASVCNEIIFKDNGISGSAIFDLSVEYARRGAPQNAVLYFDFVPECSVAEVETLVRECGDALLHRAVYQLLAGQTPRATAERIKHYIVPIKGAGHPDLAQVISGGISVDAVDPVTLEVRSCPGLYLAGEALDVDGICGGFNLYWAWASGLTVGNNV